jgi:hypothetical protein
MSCFADSAVNKRPNGIKQFIKHGCRSHRNSIYRIAAKNAQDFSNSSAFPRVADSRPALCFCRANGGKCRRLPTLD